MESLVTHFPFWTRLCRIAVMPSRKEDTKARISQTALSDSANDSFWKEGEIIVADTYCRNEAREKSASSVALGVVGSGESRREEPRVG